jgi:hypothetical protein
MKVFSKFFKKLKNEFQSCGLFLPRIEVFLIMLSDSRCKFVPQAFLLYNGAFDFQNFKQKTTSIDYLIDQNIMRVKFFFFIRIWKLICKLKKRNTKKAKKTKIFLFFNQIRPNQIPKRTKKQCCHQIHDFSGEFTIFHTFSREFTNFHTFTRNLFFCRYGRQPKLKKPLMGFFTKKSFIFPIRGGNMYCFEYERFFVIKFRGAIFSFV